MTCFNARSCFGLMMIGSVVGSLQAQIMQEALLIPNNLVQSDTLGYHVAFDGPIILGGAPFGTHGGVVQAGRAFIFEFLGGVWQHTQVLRPSRIQQQAFFGIEVAVHGNTIVVSGLGEDNRAGAVYLYERSGAIGGPWAETERKVLVSRRSIDLFGGGLSLSDDILVVGSVGRATPSGSETGASFIYERSGSTWNEIAMLYPAVGTPFGNFGFDSAIAGNKIMIGALADDNRGVFRAGAAYVFELNGGGGWTENAKLIASDPIDFAELGMSVATDRAGTTVVAGAPGAPVEGVGEAGAAYVFERNNGVWEQVAKLSAPDATPGASFGQAVAIEGNLIIVGAFLDGGGVGAYYVYRRNAGEWVFDTKIAPPPARLTYAWALALQGDRAVIGAPFHSLNEGALYVYTGLAATPGDMNCDGAFNGGDIDPFFLALGAPAVYAAQFPNCNILLGDMNGDGSVNGGDIDPFFACLGGGACP